MYGINYAERLTAYVGDEVNVTKGKLMEVHICTVFNRKHLLCLFVFRKGTN